VNRFSGEINVNASPDRIFSLYEDVSNWHQWDPEVASASIEGEFAAGTYGRLKPAKGPGAGIRIVSSERNRFFSVQSRLPLCLLTFEHELRPSGKATKVIHRVYFDGILSFLFSSLVGSQIRKGLPDTLRGLKQAAETNH